MTFQVAPPKKTPFDLVKQFDAMRQQGAGLSGSTYGNSYGGPQVGQLHQRAGSLGGFSAPRYGGGNGHYQGDGHDHSGGKGLVSYGGKQISAGLRRYADALSGMGLRFTSGYRDPAHNARVNGSKTSNHMKQGRHGALDFVGSEKQMQAGAAWAKANGAREVLIHNAGSGQHLHVAW